MKEIIPNGSNDKILYENKAMVQIEGVRRKMDEIIPPGYKSGEILGGGNSAIAWQVVNEAGVTHVLKVSTPEDTPQSQRHAAFSGLAQRAGIPAGRILQVGDGWCLEELVEGNKLSSELQSPQVFCHELALHIATLHSILPEKRNELGKEGERRLNLEKEVKKTEKYRDRVVQKIGVGNWGRIWSIFYRLIKDYQENKEEEVVCHADLTPENIFVDTDGRITGIIDFGQAMIGPREREFATIMRMEVMGVLSFPYYQLVKKSYERITGVSLREDLVTALFLLKCLKKITTWRNSPEKILRALTHIMGPDLHLDEINPLWGIEEIT